MTTMEKIEGKVGNVHSYDGKLVVWTSTGVHDIRDVLWTMKGVSLSDAQDALEEQDAEASKARKAAIKAQRRKQNEVSTEGR